MTKIKALSLVLLLGLLIAACGPQAAPATAPQAPAPAAAAPKAAPAPAAAPAVPAKAAWQEKWQETLNAAKQEGKVVIGSGLAATATTAIATGFKKAYDIPIESIGGVSSQLVLLR